MILAVGGTNIYIISFSILFRFKGRAVQTALSLDEGLKQVVPLRLIDRISPENQDRLVHLTGVLQTPMVRLSILPSREGGHSFNSDDKGGRGWAHGKSFKEPLKGLTDSWVWLKFIDTPDHKVGIFTTES